MFVLVHVVEIGVVQSLQGRYSFVRVQSDQACQQVHLELVKGWSVLLHRHALELWKS